jgi:hypothetical protein
MDGMTQLYVYVDDCVLRWNDAISSELISVHVPSLSISGQQTLLQDRLSLAQTGLSQLYTPIGDVVPSDPLPWIFNELPFTIESKIPPTTYIFTLTPERVEGWQRWWRLGKVHAERLRRTIEILERGSRLLSHVIRLILRKLTYPDFLYQFIRRERAWSLLHGSHPPKMMVQECADLHSQNFGRVSCVWVR